MKSFDLNQISKEPQGRVGLKFWVFIRDPKFGFISFLNNQKHLKNCARFALRINFNF